MSEWTEDFPSLVDRGNKDVKKLLRYLADQDLGFVGRKSSKNHIIVKNTRVPMCTESFALTPSDNRFKKNSEADVERLIGRVIQGMQTGAKQDTSL